MWVYQETKTEADALVPRLPEREPLPMKEAEQTSRRDGDAGLLPELLAQCICGVQHAAGRGVVWDRTGCRPWRSGGVPSAGAFCRRASAHLFICDAIWDRLRSALGTASDRPWRKTARFIPAYCQPADGSGGWGTLPLRYIRPTGQQPHPRLFLRERREGGRHSPYRRGTASGRTVCLADRLPLPALRRSHWACVPRKSSDAGRISGWFSCGSGPDVV